MQRRKHHDYPAAETAMRTVLFVQQIVPRHRDTWILADYADAIRQRFPEICRATAYRWAEASLAALGIAPLDGELRAQRLRDRRRHDIRTGNLPVQFQPHSKSALG